MFRIQRRSVALLSLGALAAMATGPWATPVVLEEATVKPGAILGDLRIGTSLFGTEFNAEAQRGKIVVLTIGGA